MTDVSASPSIPDIRRQLDRMLRTGIFASRPRSGGLLRYFVEESIRNGFSPINQRLIATHGLGFDAGFNPTRSAEVRVKVARLRKALDRYYAGPGRGDPVVLTITQGPYRLVPKSNGWHHEDGVSTLHDAREARRTRPMLVVVEPEVDGGPDGHEGLAWGVSLRLVSLLVESSLVIVSGPLLRKRVDETSVESAAKLAGALGYDFVAESEIRAAESPWRVRLTVTDTNLGELSADFHSRFDPLADGPPAEAIATWIYHRIGEVFTGK